MVIINGKTYPYTQESLDIVIKTLGLDLDLIVVEVNRAIIKKDQLGTTYLTAGDRVEIVQFVGGG